MLVPTPPTWTDLEYLLLPHPAIATTKPFHQDCTLHPKVDGSPNTLTLYRERNGWCMYSTRIWLALEIKGVKYDTVLVEAKNDGFDFNAWAEADNDTIDGGGESEGNRPSHIRSLPLPQVRWPINGEDDNDGSVSVLNGLQGGADEQSSLALIKKIDCMYPKVPLWPPKSNNGEAIISESDVEEMVTAFETIAPTPGVEARTSPRAGWLFKNDEGYRLDALPRNIFESFLDKTEDLLSVHSSGPFFCGKDISAADIVWAPLLERYAAQLPCLHHNLQPRRGATRNNNVQNAQWPLLDKWYRAMDKIPSYACRIKGDAPSWRKVLSVEPWWPSSDVWHSRDDVGPKGELLLSEDECINAFGSVCVSKEIWDQYAIDRPWIEPAGPAVEAASILCQNRNNILPDIAQWLGEEGYDSTTLTTEDIDRALRTITSILLNDSKSTNIDSAAKSVGIVVSYLDKRVCVPRDMGAPCAAAIRKLKRKFLM